MKEGIRRPKSPRRKRMNTNRERSRKNGEKSRFTRGLGYRKPSERNLGAKTTGSILEFPISTDPK
jgi:hypothetical protein